MERRFKKTTANKEITMFQYLTLFLFVCMPVSISAQLVDYEITKGKMDDVFLSVTGKKLVGGAEK